MQLPASLDAVTIPNPPIYGRLTIRFFLATHLSSISRKLILRLRQSENIYPRGRISWSTLPSPRHISVLTALFLGFRDFVRVDEGSTVSLYTLFQTWDNPGVWLR